MKKIYYLLLLALPLIFQSCFKDDDDIFDKPASQRMEERLSLIHISEPTRP